LCPSASCANRSGYPLGWLVGSGYLVLLAGLEPPLPLLPAPAMRTVEVRKPTAKKAKYMIADFWVNFETMGGRRKVTVSPLFRPISTSSSSTSSRKIALNRSLEFIERSAWTIGGVRAGGQARKPLPTRWPAWTFGTRAAPLIRWLKSGPDDLQRPSRLPKTNAKAAKIILAPAQRYGSGHGEEAPTGKARAWSEVVQDAEAAVALVLTCGQRGGAESSTEHCPEEDGYAAERQHKPDPRFNPCGVCKSLRAHSHKARSAQRCSLQSRLIGQSRSAQRPRNSFDHHSRTPGFRAGI